ncbi:hypothetical protein [Embleya sp. NPDC005575]|uniref:hypothetical protein n=1 Tax=Embleya sp. NPDC005575 TaxID=3156892 RepID=UPI0033AD961D
MNRVQVVTLLVRLRMLLGLAGAAWVVGMVPGAVTRLVLVVLVVLVLVLDAIVETRTARLRAERTIADVPAQRTVPVATRIGGAA